MLSLDQILHDLDMADSQARQRMSWNPERVGEIDIRIAANGDWYHEGRPIERKSMVKLFSGILRREADDYFLVTPVEKLQIEVEDAPFVATLVDCIDEDGGPGIIFMTNTEERIPLDDNHPVRIVETANDEQPRPYLLVRDGLEALISRSAFFDLLNLAEISETDDGYSMTLNSFGKTFTITPEAE